LWRTHARLVRVGGDAYPSSENRKKNPKSKLKTCRDLLFVFSFARQQCQIIDSDIGRVAILTFS